MNTAERIALPPSPLALAAEADAWWLAQQLDALTLGPEPPTGTLELPGFGSVYVQGGRLCWAAAPGLRRRLTDLLSEQQEPPLAAARLEAIYRECVRSGAPLGQALVERGVVTAEQLRAALLQHSAESLAFVAAGARVVEPRWRACAGQGYAPRFTFTSAEVLSAFGGLAADAELHQATAEAVRELGPAARCHVAFLRLPGRGVPLPFALECGGDLGCAELLTLGKGLLGTLDLAYALDDRADTVFLSDERVGAVVGWRLSEDAGLCVFCEAATDARQLLSKRIRRVTVGR